MAEQRSSTEWIFVMRDFLCQQAGELLHSRWSATAGEWDLDNPLRSEDQRKQDYLTLLRIGRNAGMALEFYMAMAAARAQRNGANYSEIGAARGTSRQAARQAATRSTRTREVTLVGGPLDGERRSTPAREIRLSITLRDPFYRDHPWLVDEEPTLMIYRKKRGAPEVFEFAHYESDDGRVVAEPDLRPRIHKIAAVWRLDTRVVLDAARKIAPDVRTPSSRVDRATVEELHRIFTGDAGD